MGAAEFVLTTGGKLLQFGFDQPFGDHASGFCPGASGSAFSRADSVRDGDVTCYTMHAFLVKRTSPHSDVTEPAGEATCLSGPRYSVRKVEESGKAPSR